LLKTVKKTVKTKRQRLYDDWKRFVLRCFLKVFKEVAERTTSGRLFHTRAAATPNVRSPTVRHRVRCTISLWVADDRRRCRELFVITEMIFKGNSMLSQGC